MKSVKIVQHRELSWVLLIGLLVSSPAPAFELSNHGLTVSVRIEPNNLDDSSQTLTCSVINTSQRLIAFPLRSPGNDFRVQITSNNGSLLEKTRLGRIKFPDNLGGQVWRELLMKLAPEESFTTTFLLPELFEGFDLKNTREIKVLWNKAVFVDGENDAVAVGFGASWSGGEWKEELAQVSMDSLPSAGAQRMEASIQNSRSGMWIGITLLFLILASFLMWRFQTVQQRK